MAVPQKPLNRFGPAAQHLGTAQHTGAGLTNTAAGSPLRMKRLVSACCQNTRSPKADTGVSVGSWRYLYSMSANLIYWTFSLKQSCQRGWGRV